MRLTGVFLSVAGLAAAAGLAGVMSTHTTTAEAKAPENLDNLFNTVMAEEEDNYEMDNGKFFSFHEVQAPIVGDTFTEYMNEYPEETGILETEGAIMISDPELIQRMAEINIRINREITPAYDIDVTGKDDKWTKAIVDPNNPSIKLGECEEYVIEKMDEFERIGIARASMSIVVVDPHIPNNDSLHAVLAVHTGQGDVIYDNLTDRVLYPHETGYTPIQATTFFDHSQWQRISITPQGVAATIGDKYEDPDYVEPQTQPEELAETSPSVRMPAPLPTWRR